MIKIHLKMYSVYFLLSFCEKKTEQRNILGKNGQGKSKKMWREGRK